MTTKTAFQVSRELQSICPCCGQSTQSSSLQWNDSGKTLIGPSGALSLTTREGDVFSVLWNERLSGRFLSREEIMDQVYALDPNGGPEGDNIISVYMSRLRKKIAPFGLRIINSWGIGYRLVEGP
jgi:DNA-binding response OmpR family regulator